MASDRSQVRSSWRPAEGSSRLGSSSGSGWRRIDPTSTLRPARGSRSTRLVFGLFGATAAYAAAFWIFLWLRPISPAGLYLVGAGYQENLAVPHNTYGLNAMAAVERLSLSGKARGWFSAVDGLGQVLKAKSLKSDAFQPKVLRAMPESTVLIYVTAQGGADEARGSAYLFQDEPNVLRMPEDQVNRSGKVYLQEIIKNLGALPSKKFCLVLDVTLAPANLPMGMIRNDFIAKLIELETEIPWPSNLVVIAPASRDQRTWVSENWRETVFGHFVAEGLARRGPGQGPRVDSRVLFDHVERKVKEWSAVNRGQEQTPILLPSGKGARAFDLARASKVVVDQSPVEPGSVPIPAPWEDRWRKRWQAYRTLKSAEPETHAPVPWREYRDWLLRYDALVRSLPSPAPTAVGSVPEPLAVIEDRLEKLAREIEQARRIELAGSLDNSLAMKVARGESPDDTRVDFNKLWESKKGAEGEDIARNRAAYYNALIARLQPASGLEDFSRAREVLGDLRAGKPLRPIEAHFLAILLRDMPPKAADSPEYRELVGIALRTRRLAERAALGMGRDDLPGADRVPYAELVAPLIEGRVAEADRTRRGAEDLLFAADPSKWEVAKKGLLEAEVIYKDAQADATTWRDALEARNRAFADLPYYASWAARGGGDEALVDDIVAAWKKANQLASDLAPVSKKPASGPTKREVPDRSNFPALTPILERFQATYRNWKPDQPGDYDQILALLDTPFLDDPDLRKAFLEKFQEKSAISASSVRATEIPEAVLRAAQRQAKLAGEASQGAFDPAKTGTRIGVSYRRNREAIGVLLKDRRAIEDDPEALRQADLLARGLVAGQGALPKDPTLAYRRRLLERLLLVQARRTLEDHWDSEEPDEPIPYYRASAEAYLGDLETLSVEPSGGDPGEQPENLNKDPGFARLRAHLARPGGLTLKTPARQLIATDEPSFGLRYRIERPASDTPGLDGLPVVWMEVDRDPRVKVSSPRGDGPRVVQIDEPDGLSPGRLGPGPTSARFGWQVDFSPIARAVRGSGAGDRPSISKATLRVEGRYRGQILRQETEFAVHPVPEIVVAQSPPRPTGDVVVRADPEMVARYGSSEGGALVIVLDCSGSMGAPEGQPPDGPSKYREATRALGTILRRVTRGTRVSLWVFGQALQPSRRAEDDQTIAQILPPTSWDPNDQGQLADLLRRIEYPALEPYNRSPIVRTMLRAKEDFAGVEGFKTMLVLTDGLDTSFQGQVAAPNQPRGAIDDVLRRAFAASDVEVDIVGYKIVEGEAAVRKQFQVIEEFHRPGTFYPVSQAEGLADTLAKALRPSLRYSVQSVGNVEISGEITLGDNPAQSGGFKDLEPGGYKLVVNAGVRYEPDMTINRGDHLVVKMAERRGRIELSRVIWTEDPPLDVPSKTQGEWRLAALMSQRRGVGLALRAALEKRLVRGETSLEMIRPREVWFEAKAGDDEGTPFQQRWSRIDAYPAPAWEMTVPSWPDQPQLARPRLSAWWDPEQEAEPMATIPRADFRSLPEARELSVPLEVGEAYIESVKLEDLPADEAPAGFGLRGAKRLVVRASYPRGQRFWIKLQGLATASAEHRFYTRANKYTGVFWPVTEEQVATSLTGLGLVSVEKFREQAERRGYVIDDLDARLPSTSDRGPTEASTRELRGPLP